MKLLLIDSNSLANRAFYALPPMTNSEGLFTNAIYGYLTMLLRLITEEKPTHVCAAFDSKAKTFRHLDYAEYKAQRKPMPEELSMQMPVLQELLTSMGIKVLKKDGIEADDIIGTLSKRFNIPSIVVTGDRDCLQLIDKMTTVYITKVGVREVRKYDKEALKDDFNFTPEQIIEYKGLAGDASDNIPGCDGVGDKTACALLNEYGDIDGIYRNIDSVKGKLKERLIENRDTVYLSKKLATICTNVDIEADLDGIAFDGKVDAKAKALMKKLNFTALITKFSYKGEEETEETSEPPVRAPLNVARVTADTVEALTAEFKKINGEFSLYLGEDAIIAYGNNETVVKISRNFLGEGISEEDFFTSLKPILRFKMITFDAKAKKHTLSRFNIELENYEDLLIKAYLVNCTEVIKDEVQVLTAYGFPAQNVAAELIELNAVLDKRLKDRKLTELYREVELPLVEVLYSMEKAGFSIDVDVLCELKKQYSSELEDIANKIYLLCGTEFNINSPKQVGDVLFTKMNLPPPKKNKNGFTVNAEVLEELDHPVAPLLLRYRTLSKLISTYLDGIRALVDRDNNKVHTVFKQCLTATGRLSSVEPNLQNIPVRKAEGKEIRKMFVPSVGNVLVAADYSQIELRLLAHLSKDDTLVDAFKNNEDIHTLTASKIFKTPLDKVTSEMRSSAKAVNFGIIYGQGFFGLANSAEVSNKEAKAFIEEYFNTYPKVKEYMDGNVQRAKDVGYLTSILGRVRDFPELKSPQFNIRSFGQRAAMNFPLQGSASDIIKVAMNKVFKALNEKKLKSKLILQVHDELIVDACLEEADEVKRILISCMENAVKTSVQLCVNVAQGKSLYEAK